MHSVPRRSVPFLAAIVLAAVLSACLGPERLPPTTLLPPVIEIAGVVASESGAEYTLTDGRSFSASRADARILGRPGGGLVILGHDRGGRFLGGFPTQGGLPADCFVDNSHGVDRGTFVELYGVLWRKAPDFVPAQFVGPDYAYPGATRFCFNARGLITSTVAP